MKNVIIVSYDSNHRTHFPDLLSNLKLFNDKYDEAALKDLPDWNDNSDYSHKPSKANFQKKYYSFCSFFKYLSWLLTYLRHCKNSS